MVRGRRPVVPARPHGRGGVLPPAPRPPCLGGDFSWNIVGICARAGNTLRRRTDHAPAADATGCHARRRPAAETGAARTLPAAASPPMQQPAATCGRIRTRESRHIRARFRSSAARNAPPPPSPLTLRGRREKGIREAGTAGAVVGIADGLPVCPSLNSSSNRRKMICGQNVVSQNSREANFCS